MNRNGNWCGRVIRRFLSEEFVNSLARETGFGLRLRIFTPRRAVWCFLVSLGSGQSKTLADIRRVFLNLTGENIEYKPFHLRLAKPSFPEFFRRLLESSMEQLIGKVYRTSSSHLRKFEDILAHDGSSFALNARLVESFPGRFRSNQPASVEVHCTYSLYSGQCTQVSVAPDIEAERHFLPDPSELEDRLLLLDAGYFWHSYFQQVRAAGGHVICRGKRPLNPRIIGVYRGLGAAEKFIGKKLSEVFLPRNTVDLLVEGRDSKGKVHSIRLVAKYSPKERGHVFLYTTMTALDIPADAVASLYRLRWQIELFFKECKSYTQLQRFQTANPHIAEGLIWATMLAVLFRRFLVQSAFNKSKDRFSTFIAATSGWTYLPQVARAALRSPARLENVLSEVLSRLRDIAGRTNPRRGDTWTDLGLVPENVRA